MSGTNHCFAPWRSLPVVATIDRCQVRDEPGVSFYSSLVGSGGNVTWNVTLPTDRSPSANQSDLYADAWFGVVLASPQGWLGQCFLELQLFPDSVWSSNGSNLSSLPGQWVAEAVGWQIDPATDHLAPCFTAPMLQPASAGGGALNMTQGDQLVIQMEGYPSSATGEQVDVRDLTNGESSTVSAYDSSGGYPLNPAYSVNVWNDSLSWGAAGRLPVSMGFDIGRSQDPTIPSNGTYGGCTPGTPPATATDPAVPCPAYDPASWAADTGQPWEIQPPVFFNGSASRRPVQVDFDQSVGGAITGDSQLSNGSCSARIGSSYCSYPWFSYSCGLKAFEFGSTDFAGVTTDFGQFAEYSAEIATSSTGTDYSLPGAAAIPGCASRLPASVTVGAGAGGGTSFLGGSITGQSSFPSIPVGEYPLTALANAGEQFAGWSVSGALTVTPSDSPFASLTISGSGSVSANFAPLNPTELVWFNESGGSGRIAVDELATVNVSLPLSTLSDGGTMALAPGLYTLLALPGPGYEFAGYGLTGKGAALMGASLPLTYLVVGTGSADASVTLAVEAAPGSSAVSLQGVGRGEVVLNGTTQLVLPSAAPLNVSLPVGGYTLEAIAAPGWSFLQWSLNGTVAAIDFANATNVSLGSGPVALEAVFGAVIDLATNPTNGGAISLNGGGPVGNGASIVLGPGTYPLDALPSGNRTLNHWGVSNRSAAWVLKPAAAITRLTVNSSVTVTANFVAAVGVIVQFNADPLGGEILFNGGIYYSGNVTNGSVATGQYLINAIAQSGYRFVGWKTTGSVSVSARVLTVHAGGGNVTALFAPKLYAVTFVAGSGTGAVGDLNGSLLGSGQTMVLPRGTYSLSVQVGPNSTFAAWSSTLTIGAPDSVVTNVTVSNAGTLTALTVPFAIASVTSTFPLVDLGVPVVLSVHVNGTSVQRFAWTGLPPGCSPRAASSVPCTPLTAGTYSIDVTVYGGAGFGVSATPLQLVVVPRPIGQGFVVTPAFVDLGGSVQIGGSVSGGVGPITYSYLGMPVGCSSANASTVVCSPRSAGTYQVTIAGTDRFGAAAFGNVSFTVTAGPAISAFTVSPQAITLGLSADFVVTPSSGVTPYAYSYHGLPSGCSSADSPSLICLPNRSGVWNITATLTDANGRSANATSEVTVNPIPVIEGFTAVPGTARPGQAVTLHAIAAGGTAPLTFNFAGMPAGCTRAGPSTVNCTAGSPGAYTVRVTVADAFGFSASAGTSFTVTAVPSATSPGPLSGSSDYLWLLVAIAVTAAAADAGVYLHLRRKRRTGP